MARGKRTKHVDVKHHIVRGAIEGKIVCKAYVHSEEQHADILTKGFDVQTFERNAGSF